MSFNSREKKRKKYAKDGAQRKARRSRPDRHYLTFSKKRTSCAECGGEIGQREECIYRHQPREIRHRRCADAKSIDYRPSLRWERWGERKPRAQAR